MVYRTLTHLASEALFILEPFSSFCVQYKNPNFHSALTYGCCDNPGLLGKVSGILQWSNAILASQQNLPTVNPIWQRCILNFLWAGSKQIAAVKKGRSIPLCPPRRLWWRSWNLHPQKPCVTGSEKNGVKMLVRSNPIFIPLWIKQREDLYILFHLGFSV